MIDLHTHILPGMDDGAANPQMSVAMLQAEKQQGVDTVVLTPHFHRSRETPEAFAERRGRALELLRPYLPADCPRLVLGAEVAWYPSLAQEKKLDCLCLEGTGFLLLELPFMPWDNGLMEQLERFAATSATTPILAHVERYMRLQSREMRAALLHMGLPMQMNASDLVRPLRRRKSMRLMAQGKWFIGSDCHNMERRAPCMEAASDYLHRRLRAEDADAMLCGVDL